MAMIGRNAAVAEVGKHRHQVEGPVAFAAWLGVHAMLLSGVHSKTDAFLTWAWDYFDRDHAATVEASSAPQRIAWGEDDEDVPHISLDRPTGTATATLRRHHGRRIRRDHRGVGCRWRHAGAPAGSVRQAGARSWSGVTGCPARSRTGTPRRSSSTTGTSPRTPGTTRTARRSSHRSTTSWAARRSSTAPRCIGCASGTSASSSTTAGSRPRGRSATTSSSRTTRRPSSCTRCTAPAARTRPTRRPGRRTRSRRCRTSRGSSSCSTTWPRLACIPFHAPCGIMLDEANPALSTCIRCATCDGFPCLVHAKSDADVIAVRPSLRYDNVTLVRNATVRRLETDPSGRTVTSVVADVDGERAALHRVGRRGLRRRGQLGQAAAGQRQRQAPERAGQRLGPGRAQLRLPQQPGVPGRLEGEERHPVPEDPRHERLLLRRRRLRVPDGQRADGRQVLGADVPR